VTAAFNLNLLRRINRELGADFALEAFEHSAIYHPDRGRVEMYLRSTSKQTVHIQAANLEVQLAEGETIHTESSHKYTAEVLSDLQSRAGFTEEAAWTDERGWFRLQCWRLRDGAATP
jgi:L-histidine Nalpha-methyltransferase